MTDQFEALRVADELSDLAEACSSEHWPLERVAARLLREQRAEIEELLEFNQDFLDENMDMLEAEIEELREAVKAEREECAKLCDDLGDGFPLGSDELCITKSLARDIRARSKT